MRGRRSRSIHFVNGARRGAFGSLRFAAVMLALLALVAFAAQSQTVAQVPEEPTIELKPDFGPAGSSVQVTGWGFNGVCAVELRFDDPDDGPFLGVPPVEEGRFQTFVEIPDDASPGLHQIIAIGLEPVGEFCVGRTDIEAHAEFRVTEPELEPRFTPIKPIYTEPLGEGFSRTESHLKFRQGTEIRLRDGEFVDPGLTGTDAAELDAVNDLLAAHNVTPSRLFSARTEDELAREKARLEQRSGREQGDKNLYYLLEYPEDTDAVSLLNALNDLDIVEIAYVDALAGDEDDEGIADPDMHTDDYRPLQGYRTAAPDGIHADAAMTIPGGRGQNVQIIDIERFFNPDHEDLPDVTVYPNGDPNAAFNPPFDHGTAVLGQLFGLDNGFGVLGLADQAAPGFVSSAGGRPNAIDIAAANSSPGDVILLELQRGGPNGPCSNETTPQQIGCVPEEFIQASYDAIVAAVSDGIIVVAAAGNGRQDLDDDDYADTLGSRPDSGAIIVGAGAAPGCTNPPRGRLVFSNSGSRVNLQGWGECVTTTGYGASRNSGLQGDADTNDAYLSGFGGTSSASPIVAAAAAIVSSVAIENGNPNGLTSTQARTLLMNTGTPQDTSAAALDGNIGPLPNLAAALGLEADLIVTKSADPDPVAAGTDLTYTVTVANTGPNVALDVVLVDELPTEVSFVSADLLCVHDAGEVTCELGDLTVGASTSIEIVVSVPHNLVYNAGGPVTITNTATATSSIDDPDSSSATATDETQVIAEADLEVVSVEISDVPAEALIGEDIPVTVTSSVRNNGPSWPIDARLVTTATPSADASADPASVDTAVDNLQLSLIRAVDQDFTIRCEGPGAQEVVFDVEISPANAEDVDPDLSNNTGQATATVECVVPIAINIRPGNQFNRVNVGSEAVIPVAALTTEAGEYGLPVAFDATLIVPETVRFGAPDEVWAETGGAPVHNGIFHIQDSFELDDRTRDGDLDMRMGFRTSETGIVSGDTEACMKGQYMEGGQLFSFFGCDFVATIP